MRFSSASGVDAPFRVRAPAPDAGAGARRVDEHAVHPPGEIVERTLAPAAGPARCARRRASAARRSARAGCGRHRRRRPGRDFPCAPRAPASCRRRRRRNRAPARPVGAPTSSAQIWLPSSCTSKRPRWKRLLGLHVRMPPRPCRPAGCAGRPASSGVGDGAEARKLPRDLLAIGLQRVDAEVERRPPGQRRALLHPVVAERRLENAARAIPEGRRARGPARPQDRATRVSAIMSSGMRRRGVAVRRERGVQRRAGLLPIRRSPRRATRCHGVSPPIRQASEERLRSAS